MSNKVDCNNQSMLNDDKQDLWFGIDAHKLLYEAMDH